MPQPLTPEQVKALLRAGIRTSPNDPPRSNTAASILAALEKLVDTLSINTWAPKYTISSDGDRRIMTISDWVGGVGPKPDAPLYITATGYSANIADGLNIRGTQGLKGWIQLTLPVADGSRIVRQVVDYIGGEGAKPTDFIGQYQTTTGYTSNIALAQDFRGAQGGKGEPGTLTTSALPYGGQANMDSSDIVIQDGTTLRKTGFPFIAAIKSSAQFTIGTLGAYGNILPILMSRYADAWQGRTITKVEKWNSSTSAWDDTPGMVGAFQRLMRGRPVTSGIMIAPGERYRVYISPSGASYARMLMIVTQYANPRVNISVRLEDSGDNGATYTGVLLTDTPVPFQDYTYLSTQVSYSNRHRITITADNDGDTTKRYHLGGLGFLTDRVSGENPYRNTLPFSWDQRNSIVLANRNSFDDPNPSALLDLSSTESGLLLPRMSQAQRDAIPSPADGLMGYQTDNAPGFWARISGVYHRFVTTASNRATYVMYRLGIGTDSPSESLEVVGTAKATLGLFGGLVVTGGINRVYGGNIDGQTLATINEAGAAQMTIGANAVNGSSDLAIINTNFASNSITFWRALSGTARKLLLSLRDGFVGIGTDSPSYSLHIDNPTAGDGILAQLSNSKAGGGSGSLLRFHQKDVGLWDIGILGNVSHFILKGWDGAGAVIERLRITNNGNVGIGTSTPTSTVHVKGTNGYAQLRLETAYTPTGPNDPNGNVGDICADDNFIYRKGTGGWRRTALSGW